MASNARSTAAIEPRMALSMRTLLATDTLIPEAVRAGIACGAPDSAAQLVQLGLSESEAAELLDEPCEGWRGERSRS